MGKKRSLSSHRNQSPSNFLHPVSGLIIDDRFRLTNVLKTSRHSTVFACQVISTHKNRLLNNPKSSLLSSKSDFVLKIEKKVYNKKKKRYNQLLRKQCTVYKALEKSSSKGSKINQFGGFSRLIACGKTGGLDFLVMDRFANSIEKIFVEFQRKFTIRTVLNIGIQAVSILEKLHKKGYIHRNIRPQNFLIGPGDSKNQLYLIDFSLARKFPSKQEDISQENKFSKFIGTLRYASISAHFGKQQSRKDDLQSLAYMLSYLLTSRVPWQGTKERFQRQNKPFEDLVRYIGNDKEYMNSQELFTVVEGDYTYCSSNLSSFLTEVRSLKVDERPQYRRYIRLMKEEAENITKQLENNEKNPKMMQSLSRLGSDEQFDWLSEKVMTKLAKTKSKQPIKHKNYQIFDKETKQQRVPQIQISLRPDNKSKEQRKSKWSSQKRQFI